MTMASQADASVNGGSSFGKGLSVLAWILEQDNPRADQIAESLKLPLSSVYRYLRELRANDFVSDTDGTYLPGPRLGDRSPTLPHHSVSLIAAPFLEHLTEVTGETAVLAVRYGLHAVCVRQVESKHQIRLAFKLGQLLPLHAGAGQRILLAFAPEEIQRKVVHQELRAYTPNTPTRAQLVRMLPRLRAEGFVTTRGELIPGSFALAAPVLSGPYAVASICLAGPRNRCDTAWQESALRELTAVTHSVAATLAEMRSGEATRSSTDRSPTDHAGGPRLGR